MEFKTTPYKHQLEALHTMRDRESFAVLWEMGCGKTKLIIDDAAYLRRTDKIDGLLVLAPNGVHRNWITDEIPVHLPDDIERNTLAWYSSKSKTREQSDAEYSVIQRRGLSVVAMSYDGFMTDRGKAFAKEFLTKRCCTMICDESTKIKTPSAKRTRTILTAGRYAKYRRILTGTPIANGPFDIYSQIKFLEPDFWKKYDIDTYLTFQHEFGVFIQQRAGRGTFKQLVRYRNVEKLYDMIKGLCHRVLKSDVLDLPPKIYQKRYFRMTEEQRTAYDRLREEFFTEITAGEVTAALAIVRLTRFAQILSNYLPVDEDRSLHQISERNPRLELLADIVDSIHTQGIIWARFREDIRQICEILGDRAVRYDGEVNDKDRATNIQRFQRDEVQFFVANPAAISMGVTLLGAKTVIYYNNSFNLTDRLQSEDRPHRIGQDQAVNYIDIVCEDSVDEHIVRTLVRKLDVASIITGDQLREWLR